MHESGLSPKYYARPISDSPNGTEKEDERRSVSRKKAKRTRGASTDLDSGLPALKAYFRTATEAAETDKVNNLCIKDMIEAHSPIGLRQ